MVKKAKASSKRAIPSAEVLWADREQLFDVLRKAPDLMVALVVTSYLDASLARLLYEQFVDESGAKALLEIDGPLESFGARCNAALAMGLIDRTTFDDLRKIVKIRNRFAHHHLALDFGDPEIGRLCDAMSLNRDPVDHITGKPVKVPHISDSVRIRGRFLMMAVFLGDKFLVRARAATPDEDR
jgi:DNA-binding MltR family transcriptional regulator